jgi:hypothetical protein
MEAVTLRVAVCELEAEMKKRWSNPTARLVCLKVLWNFIKALSVNLKKF